MVEDLGGLGPPAPRRKGPPEHEHLMADQPAFPVQLEPGEGDPLQIPAGGGPSEDPAPGVRVQGRIGAGELRRVPPDVGLETVEVSKEQARGRRNLVVVQLGHGVINQTQR